VGSWRIWSAVASGGSSGRNEPPISIAPVRGPWVSPHHPQTYLLTLPQVQANGDHRTSFAPETIATRRNKHDRTGRIVRKINAGDLCPAAHNGLVGGSSPRGPTNNIKSLCALFQPAAKSSHQIRPVFVPLFALHDLLDCVRQRSQWHRHRQQHDAIGIRSSPHAQAPREERTMITPFKTHPMTPFKLFGRLFRKSAYQILIAVHCREGSRCRPPLPTSSPTNVRQSVQMFPSACFRDASVA
jgi:hypothetical protein